MPKIKAGCETLLKIAIVIIMWCVSKDLSLSLQSLFSAREEEIDLMGRREGERV